MKRSVALFCMTFAFALSSASPASACLPWLDPLAWFGFYGCGYGYGCCNYGCQPVANAYPAYRPQVLPAYPFPHPASGAGCDCHGAVAAPAAQMTAVRVPVTTYRAVTQYVPRTTWQTQYQYSQQPAVAYHTGAFPQAQPIQAGQVYPNTSVALAPSGGVSTGGASILPNTVYSAPMTSAPMTSAPMTSAPMTSAPMTSAPITSAPVYQPPVLPSQSNLASPVPAGDIHGDHEYPTQSSLHGSVPTHTATVPASLPTPPIRRVSYGVTPQKASRYRSSVR